LRATDTEGVWYNERSEAFQVQCNFPRMLDFYQDLPKLSNLFFYRFLIRKKCLKKFCRDLINFRGSILHLFLFEPSFKPDSGKEVYAKPEITDDYDQSHRKFKVIFSFHQIWINFSNWWCQNLCVNCVSKLISGKKMCKLYGAALIFNFQIVKRTLNAFVQTFNALD